MTERQREKIKKNSNMQGQAIKKRTKSYQMNGLKSMNLRYESSKTYKEERKKNENQ